MDSFFKFFLEFMSEILRGFGKIFSGIFGGIASIFNIGKYVEIFKLYAKDFTPISWFFSILSIIIVIALFLMIGYFIYLVLRKYVRFRKTLVEQDDLLSEIASLNRETIKMQREKEKILNMKVSQLGLNPEDILAHIGDIEGVNPASVQSSGALGSANTLNANSGATTAVSEGTSRFFKLTNVDTEYAVYTPPEYNNEITLEQMCDMYRNFACFKMKLYYEIKIIRLFIAGLASTRLILLEGISGTGKTSLPYSFGKFIENDATIASVQPSWRDRTELFGYFNEFTKRFNETEVLRRMYDATYNDDIHLIILDEMNIARVEYYFAEMLSILEMPNPEEWIIDLVPNVWPNDPKNLHDGKLTISQNIWFVGTANNDDSTFAVSDKVYDRALPISIDTKGIPFDAPETGNLKIGYSHLKELFAAAIESHPVSQEMLEKIAKLDIYIIENFRLAFGNRILKQLRDFVPAFIACGGTEVDGIDYVLAHKVFRKFESLNLSFIRDELKGLLDYLDKNFGKENMGESKAYIKRLQKLF